VAGRTPSRPIIVFCRLNTSDLGLWLLRQAMTEAKDIELLYDLWEQNVDTLRTLKARSAALIQLKPLPKNRFITCLIHQRHRQNRARRDRTRDLNSYGSSGIIAPPLVANVLTVVPVCCFTMINQREKRAEEGRLTHIWLIVIVFFLMLYGLYTWGIYPFKR
jgi:hypothetical protein